MRCGSWGPPSFPLSQGCTKLVENNADVNAGDGSGRTAVMYGAKHGHTKVSFSLSPSLSFSVCVSGCACASAVEVLGRWVSTAFGFACAVLSVCMYLGAFCHSGSELCAHLFAHTPARYFFFQVCLTLCWSVCVYLRVWVLEFGFWDAGYVRVA